ncbi:MAG: phage tail tape measure protein [Bauldia litoralis]|uniref:phage tail tape measure protein n=1 Tax=Bauldia litoralis TaxID=665467 RepID=UPI003299441D
MADRNTKLKIIVDAENRSQGTFNQLSRNLDTIKQSHHGLISAMKTIGTVGTIAFGSLAYMTKGIVQAGAAFEQTNIAFETMLGDAKLAKQTLNDLAQFAAKTPFELPQVEEAAKRLLAYGTSAEDLIPTLRMLGDVSSGVGMDKLPQLILAFGQVKAATRLTGMELRQFTEAGVPLLDALAEHFGTTAGNIQEMVSAGKVGFADVQAALASLTDEGGRFNNLMEKQSQSLAGQWSNFKDQISLTARAIGQELLPYLKPMMENLVGIVQAVGEFVKEHPKLSAGILAAALALTGLLAVLLPLAFALPGLILMFSGLATIFAFIVTGPGILMVAFLATLGFALIQLTKVAFLLGTQWDMIWLGMKVTAAEVSNAVIGFVETMVNWIIDGVNVAIRAINKVVAAMARIPFAGNRFKGLSIDELDRTEFGRLDTNTIANQHLNGAGSAPTQNSFYMTGNVLLDQDAAEKIGDMIMDKLKLSNAL